MASNKKPAKPAEQKTALEDEVIDGPEAELTDDPSDAPADPIDEVGSDKHVADDQSPAEDVPEEAAEPQPDAIASQAFSEVFDLHDRLTKAVRAIASDAGQEKTFALQQLEMLTGRLKMVLPAGIAATEKELQADLNTLLGLL
ncbi:MAG: hypothetical protein K8U57_27745 [Planctomycetes bacterium]|nr:hypothetical protein [Planctomycetota bacterium]